MTNIIRKVENDVEFFTVESTGESGMSIRGLALASGKALSTIQALLRNLTDGKIPTRLKPLQGKDLYLTGEVSKNGGIVKIVRAEICAAIIKHYAFEGSEIAEALLDKFSTLGINTWIQNLTGWEKKSDPFGDGGTPDHLLPEWYQRTREFDRHNWGRVPAGYFSIFEETLFLVRDLERVGYVLPKNLTPDISIGKCWASYLKKIKLDVEGLRTEYIHHYPDGRAVSVYCYHESLLPEYRKWSREVYKPQNLLNYAIYREDPDFQKAVKRLSLPCGAN